MKNILKILTLLLILNAQVLYAQSDSDKADILYNQAQELYAQKKYKEAIPLYEESYKLKPSKDTPANIGISYKNIGNSKNAIKWYTIGVNNFKDKNSAYNLGLLYEGEKNIDKAVLWYKETYKMGDIEGANNLGYIYQYSLDDIKSAELWYKKAVVKNHQKAIGNLAKLYHKQNKNELGAAYLISLIDNGHTKSKVINYLKTNWKLNDKEIKKAYQLQLTLDIPKHYAGGIN